MDVSPQQALVAQPRMLHDLRRSGITRIARCLDPLQPQLRETEGDDAARGLGHVLMRCILHALDVGG